VTTRAFGGSLPEARSISVPDAGRPSNQLSNDRRRQRQTPVDTSGRYVSAQKQDAKAMAVDEVP